MKPPNRTAASHKANVMKLTAKPAIAHLDLSLSSATRPTKNMKGGPNIMRIPPRSPRTVPHPKPGTSSISATIKNQGNTARPKLSLPILLDFILLYSLLFNWDGSFLIIPNLFPLVSWTYSYATFEECVATHCHRPSRLIHVSVTKYWPLVSLPMN